MELNCGTSFIPNAVSPAANVSKAIILKQKKIFLYNLLRIHLESILHCVCFRGKFEEKVELEVKFHTRKVYLIKRNLGICSCCFTSRDPDAKRASSDLWRKIQTCSNSLVALYLRKAKGTLNLSVGNF